mgnify:CR=1 FL=1
MNSPLLEKISQPSDLKKLSSQQTVQLCAEIREFLLDNVSKTGGHLASNLGAVELTVALHRVLTTPTDEIVFDVGHQCYTHKLLTGRREGFAKLRQLDGISGFPNPNESEHDAFIAGHGNTALSLWALPGPKSCGASRDRWVPSLVTVPLPAVWSTRG